MPWLSPDFNLTANFYAYLAPPPGGAVIYSSVCAWVEGRRVYRIGSYGGGAVPNSYLLLPTGLSIHQLAHNTNPDIIRLVGMTNCHWYASYQTLVAAGHPNEHIQLEVVRATTWPDLLPSPTPN